MRLPSDAKTMEDIYLQHPMRLTAADEQLHPRDGYDGLWSDTLWLSSIDPRAGIVGVNALQIANRGFVRFQSHYWIDGVQQSCGRKAPMAFDPNLTRWSDGCLAYEVVKPFEHVRLTMDNAKFGFELDYEARFPAFEWNDCAFGNPTGQDSHGGHFEQAMRCRGRFEIRDGPQAGETREIDCLAHRDHSWSDRFAQATPWELPNADIPSHFWLALQFPHRNLNAVGFFDAAALGFPDPQRAVGGFESSARGNRPVVAAEPVPAYDGDVGALRRQGPDAYRIVLAGDEVLHVRVTKVHGTAKLWMRGEDDLENRLDDWERIVELEIEETGERGHGVFEHSVVPAEVRWPS
jgi:hypothetical protein